jgi:hypothetical protein
MFGPLLYVYWIRMTLFLSEDPWRESTVSAALAPTYSNTTEHPVGDSDGFHCSDLKMGAGANDPSVIGVQQQALAAMKRWIAEFPR